MSEGTERSGAPRVGRAPWIAVALACLTAGLLHYAPYWHATMDAPPGWSFTGVHQGSPDVMQYRVWVRQSAEQGPIVNNTFTVEPNPPHIPVLPYWGLGVVARTFGISPEWAGVYLGGVFAALFIGLLCWTARRFLPSWYAAAWVTAVIAIGGGLGGHLRWLGMTDFVRDRPTIRQAIVRVLRTPTFEDLRGNYVFYSLFDAHFVLFWLLTTLAVLAVWWTYRRFSWPRLALAAGLCVLITAVHLYEGVTLIAILALTAPLCARVMDRPRHAWMTAGVCSAAIGVVLLGLAMLWRSSGLGIPDWHAEYVLLGTVVMAFPLAWALMAWGFRDYWARAGLNERFLVGWMAGCLAVTLSGPLYPYTDRGTMTLQIPVYLIAGGIWFARRERVRWPAVLVVLALLAPTPAWMLRRQWLVTSFAPEMAFKYQNADHASILAAIRGAAPEDVLIVNKLDPAWLQADIWLAPEYPGRHYAGHFFLTVDYHRRAERVRAFYRGEDPDAQAAFLREAGITLVWVSASEAPERFAGVPGLVPLVENAVGTLFRRVESGP